MGQMEIKAEEEAKLAKHGIINKRRTEFIQHFSDSVQRASSRTREYLIFHSPEHKFSPSLKTLEEIFLMTYISHSRQLQMTDHFSCTVMSRVQKILLGVDWVWTITEMHSKVPEIQLVVQVVHLPKRQRQDYDSSPVGSNIDAREIANTELSKETRAERMIKFCSSVSQGCYALFLFFGSENDSGDISGVLSNNFHAALGKCARLDRTFLESFFKGAVSFVTPAELLRNIIQNRRDSCLTMLVKFI